MARKSKLENILEKENLTEQEAITVIKSSRAKQYKNPPLGISGKRFRYGYFSDTHIGHKEFKPELYDKMCTVFKKEKVEFIVTSGDIIEGMSNRPGHVYELTHIGIHQQLAYAKQLFDKLPTVCYGITGNHDDWAYKPQNMGIVVGEELEQRVKNFKFVGRNEGIIIPKKNVKMMLFHPNDGSAYSLGYKMQKLIESFSGGDKPNIVHQGHYHKSIYMFIRNVHGFESSTLMGQSEWMRGKKIAAHIGFGIVDVYTNKNGVDRIVHSFFPYY